MSRSLSENLGELMQLRGLNQVDLSRKSGVSQALISSYLRKSAKAKYPNLRNLIALGRALNCTLEALAGIEEPESNQTEREIISPSKEQVALWEAYNKLPEGHWLRVMIEQELLDRNDS